MGCPRGQAVYPTCPSQANSGHGSDGTPNTIRLSPPIRASRRMAAGSMPNTVVLAPNPTDGARRETQVGSCGPTAHVIPAMGIAHGFASPVILRAESPVDAGVFRQSNASLGRTFSPQSIHGLRFLGRCPRLVSRRAVGPEECHRMLRVKRHVGDGLIPQDSGEWLAFGCYVTVLVSMPAPPVVRALPKYLEAVSWAISALLRFCPRPETSFLGQS